MFAVHLVQFFFMKNIQRLAKPNINQLLLTITHTRRPFHKIIDLLSECSKKQQRNQLDQVHAHMITTNLIHYLSLAAKLVSAFASIPLTSSPSIAHSIADQIAGLDSYTWNSVIRGFLDSDDPKNAILVYCNLKNKNLVADTYTLLFTTKACGYMTTVFEGKQMHTQILKLGFVSEVIICTALLSLYSQFDEVGCMRQVFDEMPHKDLVAWNSLVVGYARRKDSSCRVLAVWRAMISGNVNPNGVTVVSSLSVFASLAFLREGKAIHCYILRKLIDFDVFVYNALIGMYSRCGLLIYARLLFLIMPVRNVVSWTTMINAYTKNEYLKEALELFNEMIYENIKPDEITILDVISLCSKFASFELAEKIDHYVHKHQFGNRGIENALIDMHARCGNIKRSCQIFDKMTKERTLVSWTSIIQGLATHGYGVAALVRFCQMEREGFRPDRVLFLTILSACSNSGLVSEGRKCFDLMTKNYGLEPWMEHYGCMVDLFCRAGLVKEAHDFSVDMPVEPDSVIWRILLSACRSNGNMVIAARVLNRLRQEDGTEDYLLLSNFYAGLGDWDGVKKVRNEMEDKGMSKRKPGFSSIEV